MAPPYQFKSFPYSSHDWILKILAREKRALRILDFGTATGYLGMRLREQGHSLAGVEADAEAAAQARAFYDPFYVADLNDFEFPARGAFDWILFADVLEHLREPGKVLARALPCLNPSGKILISAPNVAYFAIRLGLLAGRFDYADRGILDRTHLRFFTLRSLEAMIERAGCRVLDVQAAPAPVQLAFPSTRAKAFAPLHLAHYALVCLRKQLFAYQFVLTARPDGPAGKEPR
jgi:2-polyprenyl-3-methyl-5-hydroxy-6-metoxy-1,4-benzoquinol methylase